MSAVGTVNASVVASAIALFEERCIILLEWACQTLNSCKSIDIDWGEENITANIYVLIHDCQMAIDFDIYPESEHPFYDQDILDNKKKAKAASRIDLLFQNNWDGKRFSFFVEAKNLIEKDVQKKGRKSMTLAKDVLKRYIETGIDHYIGGYYPQGCMLGYVLNGSIEGVVNALNNIFIEKARLQETLKLSAGDRSLVCYKSSHAENLQISHYLFDFASQKK